MEASVRFAAPKVARSGWHRTSWRRSGPRRSGWRRTSPHQPSRRRPGRRRGNPVGNAGRSAATFTAPPSINNTQANSNHGPHLTGTATPRSRGGADHLDNLQLLCLGCNSSKGNRTMPEWRAAQRRGGGDNKGHGATRSRLAAFRAHLHDGNPPVHGSHHPAHRWATKPRPDKADRLVLACEHCPPTRPSKRRPPRWATVARQVAARPSAASLRVRPAKRRRFRFHAAPGAPGDAGRCHDRCHVVSGERIGLAPAPPRRLAGEALQNAADAIITGRIGGARVDVAGADRAHGGSGGCAMIGI